MADSTEKRTSRAWLYFTDLKNNKAKCNFCSKVMSYKGGGPYNLTRHTKTQHPGVLNSVSETSTDMDNISPAAAGSTSGNIAEKHTENPIADSTKATLSSVGTTNNTNNNQKLTTFFRPLSSKKTELLNKTLIEIVSKNYLPFQIVESQSFKNFIKELNPHYTLPCRKTLTNVLLPNYYNIEKDKVKMLLEETDYVAITTDGWTSKPNESYIALSVHFLNKNTELKSCMLECHKYNDRHTAENLKNELIRMCDDWKITDKVVAVTTDNAANVKAAVRLIKWKQIPCFAHTLNLIVQSALKEIKPTQSKVKAIVEHFKRSPLATQRLKAMQKQLGHKEVKLKQDVVTRWNSTFTMFQSVIDAKNSLMSVIAIEYPELDNINNGDLETLTTASELLSLFKDVTDLMISEKKVTISQVILISNALKKECCKFLTKESLPECVKQMAQVLLNELSIRFNNIEENNIFAESTLLDPRFKKHGFINDLSYGRACSNLKQLVANIHLQLDAEIDNTEQPPSPKKMRRSIWDDFDEQVKEIIHNSNPTAASIIEVDKYLQEPLLQRNKDPFKWWHEKKELYPRLYQIVKKRMCISATSVPSERIFSKSGQIISERRNRLSGKNVDMLLFLNNNM